MRLEIGETMTSAEAVEIIKNNLKGVFVVENGKIFYETESVPVMPKNVNPAMYGRPQQSNNFAKSIEAMGQTMDRIFAPMPVR